MEYMQSGTRKSGSLLSNVFNYDLGMMTEKTKPTKNMVTTTKLINQYEKEDKLLKENVNPLLISGANDITHVPTNGVGQDGMDEHFKKQMRDVNEKQTNESLLSNIWNYNVGMMKEQVKQKKPRTKSPVIQSTTKRDNVKQSVLNHKEPEHRRKTVVPPSTPHMLSDHLQKPKSRSPLTPLSPNILPHFNQITTTHGIKYSAANQKQQSMFAAAPRITPESPLSYLTSENYKRMSMVCPLYSNQKNNGGAEHPTSVNGATGSQKRPRRVVTGIKNDRNEACTRGKTPKPRQYKDDIDYSYVADFDSDDSDVLSEQDICDEMDFNNYPCQKDASKGTHMDHTTLRDKGKQPFGTPSRTLDFNENEREGGTMDFNQDIEYSHVADFQSDQSDGESEGEIMEVDYDSLDMQYQTENVVKEYATLGPPNVKCNHCQAWMWKEERTNKTVTRGTPVFSICCAKGQIQLPKEKPTPSFIWQLHNDKEKSQRFKDGIRLYNSLFAFTSTGGKVDHSINKGGAPYIYRLNGQNHHLFGSLIPEKGDDPKFCQLYIYDTQNEISNRLRWVNVADGHTVDAEIVEGLKQMLDQSNELVKEFRSARDRFEESGVKDLEIILKVSRAESGRQNHVGPSDEVAGIMVGDMDDTDGSRDIIIDSHVKGLERISDIHPKLMALQYPLLFPHGGDGFHKNIPFGKADKNSQKKREMITMKEYYSYKFQVRTNEAITPRLGGRLYQQYVVDAFSTIEQARLWWFRTNQTTLRSELYTNIQHGLTQGSDDTSNLGKGFILPAGFVGSRRYMQQNFQDALAVCRYIGHPDIFLTMTTNSVWDEVIQMMKLLPQCSAPNSPDVMARVFRLKLDQLIDDIKKNKYFGTCIGVMYVVEFQKRGLPHVHMLIWLDSTLKRHLQSNVDKFVSAEIPDPEKDPLGYEAVKAFMMHGPCGQEFLKSPCMTNYKCTRHFPKK